MDSAGEEPRNVSNGSREETLSPAPLEPEGSRSSQRNLEALIAAARSVDSENCYEDDISSPEAHLSGTSSSMEHNAAVPDKGTVSESEGRHTATVIAGDKTSSDEQTTATERESGSKSDLDYDHRDASSCHRGKGQSTGEDEEKKDYCAAESAHDKIVVRSDDENRRESDDQGLQLEDILKAVNRHSNGSGSETGNTSGDGEDSNGMPSSSNLSEKRPMDASGLCSLDMEENDGTVARGPLSPVQEGTSPQSLDPPVKKTGEDGPSMAEEAATASPTPMGTPEKQASNEAIANASNPPSGTPPTPLSTLSDELLRNKGKEGFGLLARGEQASDAQQHRYHSTNQQPSTDDPNAIQNRAANNITPSNEALQQRYQANISDHTIQGLVDENSYYKPTFSYPSSPQGLPPQAIPFQNGGYIVMPPHHQGQPTGGFSAQPTHQMLHHQASFGSHPQMTGRSSFGYTTTQAPMPPPAPEGKRKIRLKLQEEILARPAHARRKSFFQFAAGHSIRKLNQQQSPFESQEEQVNEVDRGTITVSWFEGTSSTELSDHVTRSVTRKLKLGNDKELDDIRVLDTKTEPPEEIVLCPYIPSGSEFVLRYKIKTVSGRNSQGADTWNGGPPDSPSAAPSPFPSRGNLGSLDPAQLSMLRKELDEVQSEEVREGRGYNGKYGRRRSMPELAKPPNNDKNNENTIMESSQEIKSAEEAEGSENESETETLQPENSVDARLRQITDLLLMDRKDEKHYYPRVQKRQVLMVLANYFVLFIAFITISAEIQARAPNWLSWMERELENVQNCSADKDALFQCVSNGEFAGLFATLILWISRSATTKRIFLFGFDSPRKLWAVVYESLVGAICWGCSYMFIRRGMNPDTRPNFLQKYWKDAVYGSLAGFNATFMKQVLKNLIPQEAVEEAFNDRQLKILSWLPSFA